MASIIIFLLVLATAWGAYRAARRQGVWSNKQFVLVLLSALALVAVVMLPLQLLPQSTIDAHQGAVLATLILAILGGVVLITIVADKYRKRPSPPPRAP